MRLDYNRKKLHHALFYLLLVLILIFISGTVFLLSPLILLGPMLITQIILFIIGITLGFFLVGFIKDLDELTHTHHASLIIIFLIASFLNFLAISTGLKMNNTTYLKAILSALNFTVSFLIPYIYHHFNKR